MCGRFTMTRKEMDEVAAELEAEFSAEDAARWRPRFNVAPTDTHWIVVLGERGRRLVPATWGFRAGGSAPLAINARAETAAEKPAFRDAFRRRRCVVAADGFFEWTGAAMARRPLWFHAPDGAILPLAGLYTPAPDGHLAFTILTTDANERVAPVHDRMPVILPRGAVGAWLEEPLRDLLVPAPAEALVATEVSMRVNSVANDDPACLEPVRRLL